MKRCPECRRDYYDDSLIYCLDDGARLLDGPTPDGPPTAILPSAAPSSEEATKTFGDNRTTNEDLPADSGGGKRAVLLAVSVSALLLVALIGWAAYTYYGRSTSRQIESIAVLPFVNAAGNPDLEYLSDGITESLINSLSQIPTLSVKARSSVFTYKGKEVTPQQVSKDLSVQAVLNGRVMQRGDQVVLNVELVDASTGNQVWGEQYTRKTTDLIELQGEITRAVSGRLRAKLTGAEQEKVAKNYTENTEAYQHYLRGRHHWNKRKADDIRKSIEYFQKAIDADPTYALAYASLAEAFILIPNYRLGSPSEYYPKARAAAARAIEIDESLAEAHNALASVTCNYDWKFADAERGWKKALDLNPNYATAHQWYAEFLLSMGRYPEAVAEMRRARELDPLSLIINGMLGVLLMLNDQPEEALEQLKKTLEIDPNFARTHLFMAEVYQSLGRYEEAIDEFSKHYALSGRAPDKVEELAAVIRKAYRSGGPTAYSRAFAEIIESNQGTSGAPAFVLAGYWAHAGEHDKAFEILEKAYADHDDSVLSLKDRRLDPIKSDPRYKNLLRRVGLPE
ncbi:MAG TPA: tetratricopeptide repeat protein [Pyrinomonadaceae bacterium]